MIDEVRIYNLPLSEAEIQADMNTPITNLTQDTQAPTAPGSQSPTVTGNQVGLSWTASTDNVGVTGYNIYRLNPGASSYVEIATTTATTYTDAGLAGDAAYSYKVQATDAAGNLSQFSSIMPITTSFGISPHVVELTAAQTEQFAASNSGVTWAVNGIVGGSAAVGTITATGLYTAPSTAGTYTVTATIAGPTQSDSATVYVSNYAGTDTFHNDTSRSGDNLNETVLTPANVNSTDFGQLASYQLDGEAIASPLYVADVNIPGKGVHNVVYVETENDSVYAFDADGLTTTPLWHDSLINPAAGITPVPANDTGETGDIPNEIGITGTPVIDPTTNTMYFVTATKDVSGGVVTYVQELHALDITTGAEKFGGPVVIQATVPGTGPGSVGGEVSFNSLREDQRTAMLLLNGVVYFGFSSHGDVDPYYGWFMGYNATTLKQVMVFNAAPNAGDDGIWMDGDGAATDSSGDIFFITGDGTFDVNTGGVDYGDSYMKLSPSGSVVDYFTPSAQSTLDADNLDLGSGGILLLPTQSGPYPDEMVSAGKGGTIYLVNRDSLGHYNPNTDADIQSLTNIFTNSTGGDRAQLQLANLLQRLGLFQPVWRLSPGVSADPTDLLSTSPTSESSEAYHGRGAHDGHLRRRQRERHFVDGAKQRHHGPRCAACVSGVKPRDRALQQQPGRLARCSGRLVEVQCAPGGQRQGLCQLAHAVDHLRAVAQPRSARRRNAQSGGSARQHVRRQPGHSQHKRHRLFRQPTVDAFHAGRRQFRAGLAKQRRQQNQRERHDEWQHHVVVLDYHDPDNDFQQLEPFGDDDDPRSCRRRSPGRRRKP